MEMNEMDQIKSMLQKVVDEMDSMESNRILPDGHPSKMTAMAVKATPEAGIAADEPDMNDDSTDMDPNVLSQLMDKATTADDSGTLPEDQNSDLPPEILAAVERNKKKPV